MQFNPNITLFRLSGFIFLSHKVLGTKLHPKTKVKSGVLSKECKLIVDAFFIKKRKEKAL